MKKKKRKSKAKKFCNRKKIILVILLLLLCFVGISFAWLMTSIQGEKEVSILVDTIKLELDESASEGIRSEEHTSELSHQWKSRMPSSA